MPNEAIEHAVMKDELKKFRESFEMLLAHSKERDIKVDAMVAKVEDMYKVFNNGSFLVTVIKWIFGTILAIGGGYLMIREIIKSLI